MILIPSVYHGETKKKMYIFTLSHVVFKDDLSYSSNFPTVLLFVMKTNKYITELFDLDKVERSHPRS